MKIDAVAVASTNFEKSVTFYSALGFAFPNLASDTKHVEAITKTGEVRLMIDDAAMMEEINGEVPKPGNTSSFAILCESVEELNTLATKIKDQGFTIVKEPWDAFWGQRYAVVEDPDGYLVDLFAVLPK